jgi:hypothetical protein
MWLERADHWEQLAVKLPSQFPTSAAGFEFSAGLFCLNTEGTTTASLRCAKSGVCVRGSGMTPAKLAARYRNFAAECWFFAQQQNSANDKLSLIELAQGWLDLAECVEKNGALFALSEEADAERYH